MALLADTPGDRAGQLIVLTKRLTALILEETRHIDARLPPLAGAEGDEKNRLANAYRLELARIKQEPTLLEGAPPAMLSELRQCTTVLHEALAGHETALGAIKLVTEGMVQAMAEEVHRQRGGGASYGAKGALETPTAPIPTMIDRNA